MSEESLDKHYQDCPGCLCELRTENERLKQAILSSSDLYDKLVTKQLHTERQLVDELAACIRKYVEWFGDDFDAKYLLGKYDQKRQQEVHD